MAWHSTKTQRLTGGDWVSRDFVQSLEIHTMIEKLNGGIQEVVQAMDRSSNRMGESVRHAEGTATALKAITEAVLLISDRNIQISSAAEEKSRVAEDISRNI